MKKLLLFFGVIFVMLSQASFAEETLLLENGCLTLPDSLQVIKESAFERTSSVSHVVVPNGVKRIEKRAFAQSSLGQIDLPDSLEYIADDAFEGCTDLKAYIFEDSYALEWCIANNVQYDYDPNSPLTKLDTPAIKDIELQNEYTAVFVTWDPVRRAQGYRLYCIYPWDPENCEWIKTIFNENSVKDTDLETCETYIYSLQAYAYNADGELVLSEMSEPYVIYVGETVDKPVIEEITTIGVSGLRLNWQAARNAAAYDIYRSETGEENSFVKIATTSELSYEDNGLASGTQYWYCIQGQSLSGVLSPMSAVRQIETDQVKYRALLIGNTYPGAADALPGPDNDIAAMANMLKLQTATPYTVKTMLNVNATQIASGISQAFAGADSTDVSVFYYSGHGTQNGSLCGTDNTRMSALQLRNYLDQIPGTKVVLLDCCYSGYHINKSAGSTNVQTMEEAFNEAVVSAFAVRERSLTADEYIVLTACSMRQSSVSDVIFANGRLFYFGAYTYALTKGSGFDLKTQQVNGLLADEDGDANNQVTLGEAYDYVVKVIEADPRYSQDTQYYGDLSFVLWGQKP